MAICDPVPLRLHGTVADTLVDQGVGPIGLTASEITDAAREMLNQWVDCS